MPWSIQEKDNKFCVVKDADGSIEGCHDTKMEAEDQRKALYESENKTKMYGMAEMYPMWGITSFAKLDDLQQARHAAHEMGELIGQFQMIANNIMEDPEITDKAGAIRALSDELVARMGEDAETEEKGIFAKLKSLISPKKKEEDHTGLMLWKDKSTGAYRWFAIYSNMYRDDDYPPEIISSTSHQNFVKMVNDRQVPMPELWQWHIPGTRWGVADWVDFTPNGFAIASGTVDEGCEAVAEAYAKDANVRVSHGMPKPLIVRDVNDSSIINFHVTTEISPLPLSKEANPLTGFNVFDREVKQMSLSEEQKQHLMSHGLDADQVSQIEAGIGQLGKQAEGRESKQKERTLSDDDLAALAAILTSKDAEVAEEVQQEEPITEEATEEQPHYVTHEELAAVVAGLVEGTQSINESVKALKSVVDGLQQTDADKIAKAAENTPAASLSALIASSIIGKQAAYVDGRTSEAKDGPKETKKESTGLFFQEWIDGGVAA